MYLFYKRKISSKRVVYGHQTLKKTYAYQYSCYLHIAQLFMYVYNFVHAKAIRLYSWLQLSCHPPFCMLLDVLIFPLLWAFLFWCGHYTPPVFLEEPDYGLWVGLPLSEWGIKKIAAPSEWWACLVAKRVTRCFCTYYRNRINEIVLHAMQMKGRRESDPNVWFSFIYSHKCNCYLQNIIIMFLLPVRKLRKRFIDFQDRSAFSAAGKYVDRSWEYINRSQTHECENLDWGRAIPREGIHKSDFPCSVVRMVSGDCLDKPAGWVEWGHGFKSSTVQERHFSYRTSFQVHERCTK